MNLIQQIFSKELAEDGIADLRRRYPEDFMDGVKMDDDNQFKDARKIKTERNKLVKAINDKRISFTGEVKKYSDSIVSQINEIYEPIVDAFELEDTKRKEAKAEEERKLAILLDEESKRIKEVKLMVDSARNESSDGIQCIIEAVDLIDTKSFHKELIHEAIEVKESVLSDLAGLLSSAIASEKVAEERARLKVESDKLKHDQEIQQRIDKLRMMPSNFVGRKSLEITKKIDSLSNFEVKEDDFDDRVKEVVELLTETLNQLSSMRDQAVELEEFQEFKAKAKADKEEAEELEKKKLEAETTKEETAIEVSDIDKPIDKVDTPESEEPAVKAKTLYETAKDVPSVKEALINFLSFCATDELMIENFGYLLLSNDVAHNSEAIEKIKAGFSRYTN